MCDMMNSLTILQIFVVITSCHGVKSRLLIQESQGFRIERVGYRGHQVNFTWVRNNTTAYTWLEAHNACADKSGKLPESGDLRYFYKTLPSDVFLQNQSGHVEKSVVFYLSNVLEATMDYPNGESGERLCLSVEKRPNSMLHLAEQSAIKSCNTPSNLLVCKFDLDSQLLPSSELVSPCGVSTDFEQWPKWVMDLKQRAELNENHLCMTRSVFYALIVGTSAFILISILMNILFLFRYKEMNNKLRHFNLTDATSTMGYKALWSTNSNEATLTTNSTNTTSNNIINNNNSNFNDGMNRIQAGKLDLLTDSNLCRAQTKGGGSGTLMRESYKGALINSGYQRASLGRRKEYYPHIQMDQNG